MRPRIFALLIAPFMWQTVFAQTKPAAASPGTIPRFVDISRSAGLTVSHISSADKKYIIESVSGGVGNPRVVGILIHKHLILLSRFFLLALIYQNLASYQMKVGILRLAGKLMNMLRRLERLRVFFLCELG